MKTKKCLFLVACMPVAAFGAAPASNASAAAEPGAGAPSAAVADVSSQITDSQRLAALLKQIPLLQAQDQIAKLKHDIAINEGGGQAGALPAGTLPAISAPAAPPAALLQMPQRSAAHSSIRAIAVNAFDGRYNAVLDVDGRTITVRVGEPVGDGWNVSAITEASVTIVNGKQVRILRV